MYDYDLSLQPQKTRKKFTGLSNNYQRKQATNMGKICSLTLKRVTRAYDRYTTAKSHIISATLQGFFF
jgi:hypothetical protein